MRHRPWTMGLGLAVLVAAGIAGTASFLDWRLNPGGVFRNPEGTSWPVVWETWVSWFVPAVLLIAALLIPSLAWYERRP